MKTIPTALITQKNTLASASSWLTLLQIEITSSTTLYLVANPSSVTFDGNTYSPFPCDIAPVSTDSRGGLPDVEVSVSNVGLTISAYIEANDVRGKRVRLLGVNSDNLADTTALAFDETYEIGDISVTQEVVRFRLGHVRMLEQRFPSRRFLRDNCVWLYKSDECGYAGVIATCDKSLESANGCRVHANQVRFGGFPGIPSVSGRR